MARYNDGSTYTPGPWKWCDWRDDDDDESNFVEYGNCYEQDSLVGDEDAPAVLWLGGGCHNEDLRIYVSAANKALIAAAPDMLAVLKRIMSTGHDEICWEAIQAAIDKAEPDLTSPSGA